MLSIEEAARLHCRRIVLVKAARVDAVVLGVRARLVEGVDAAMPAKGVFRYARAKGVGRHLVSAAQDFEALVRDGQMQDALLCADRAVAFPDHGVRQIDLDAEPHPPAMTASFICLEHRPLRHATALTANSGPSFLPSRLFSKPGG